METSKSCWVLFISVLLAAGLRCSYGQYSCDEVTSCSCEGANFSRIDVAEVLKPTIATPIKDPIKPDKYEYLINFCKGRTCENDPGIGGGKDAVVCQRQIDEKQNVSVKLGDVNHHTWQVFDNNTFTVLFDGGDVPGAGGDGTRSAMLYVFVVDKTYTTNPLNSVKYVEERITGDNNEFHVYVFAVYVVAPEKVTTDFPEKITTETPVTVKTEQLLTTMSPTATGAPPTPSKLSLMELLLVIFLYIMGSIVVIAFVICCVCVCLVYCQRRITFHGYSQLKELQHNT